MQAEIAFPQHFVLGLEQFAGVRVAPVELGLTVGQDHAAFDQVPNQGITEHFHLRLDPTVAMIGIGMGIAKFKSFMVLVEGIISTNYSNRYFGSVNLKFNF